jgi:hypothetical protein
MNQELMKSSMQLAALIWAVNGRDDGHQNPATPTQEDFCQSVDN